MTEPVPPTRQANGIDGLDRPVALTPNPEPKQDRGPQPESKPKPTALDQLGGSTGLVYMMLPIVAFVLANASLGLVPAICTALGVALAISAARLIRKEPLQPALSGLFGVAIASFVAWKSGSANGYFLVGIWSSLILCGVFLLSVLVRRPLAGIVWSALNGTGNAWLKDKPSRHYYDIATLTLAGVFAARYVVQEWLYEEDATGWLAVAKIAMGYPLLALALIVVVWAARCSGKRLKALAGPHPAGQV